MENFIPEHLVELLISSMVFSIILMALIQKFKALSFIKYSWQVWFLNLFLAFLLGIPFTTIFYGYSLIDGFWVGGLSFIGASTIYETLKSQNFINYKPNSVSNSINISRENEIKRENI